jgi:hypothetical protein
MAEPLRATFFTLKRRDRAVLLPATLVFLAIMTVIIAAFVALNWGTIVQFQDFMQLGASGEQPSEEASLQFMGRFFALFGTILLFMFPIYITIAAYEAACLRWMIRGEAPGLFGLTINNDVWRVWGVYWCWVIAQMAISMAMSIVMIPMMFMTMGEIMRDPSPEAMMRWQLTVQLPLTLLQYIPLIFIGIRFGPAAATSVQRNRFSFFEAWTVTNGRFWTLFGSFAVLWLLAGLAIVVIFCATYGALIGDLLPRLISDPTTFPGEEFARRIFSPRGLTLIGAGYVASAVVMLIYAVMGYGVNARAAIAAQEAGKIAFVPDEA